MLPGRLLMGLELALVAGLGVQAARLVWEIATPIGRFGDWQPRPVVEMSPAARAALFAGFDPFYRTAQTETNTQNVTALSLQLFGTRVNQASGLGSAIIATPDGAQASYAVGDEIVSGVALKAVAIDHVVLAHGGSDELLFLDQSTPAPVAQPGAAPGRDVPAIAGSAAAPLTADRIRAEIGVVPRTGTNGGVTGLAVSPLGSSAVFSQLGFHSGDVIVSVNGRPIRSAGDLQLLAQALTPGARVALQVERGPTTVPLALVLSN